MNNQPYARITIDDHAILLRFGGLERGKFHAVLERFFDYFPVRSWNEMKRCWQLPATERERLVSFCADLFGESHVRVITRQWTLFE